MSKKPVGKNGCIRGGRFIGSSPWKFHISAVTKGKPEWSLDPWQFHHQIDLPVTLASPFLWI